MKPKKLYVCTDHDCVQPTGVASIVLADNEKEARVCMDIALIEARLKPYDRHTYTLQEISLFEHTAHILCNGDY